MDLTLDIQRTEECLPGSKVKGLLNLFCCLVQCVLGPDYMRIFTIGLGFHPAARGENIFDYMEGLNPGLESAATCEIIFSIVKAVQYFD